jgi:murein endopeptidase
MIASDRMSAVTKPTYILLPQVSGYGYYSYSSLDRQYATQDTIDTIVQVGTDWFRNTAREFGVGDMSFEHGGRMEPHASHYRGTTVDIRPLRTDNLMKPTTISDAKYDQAGTRLLISAFLAHKNVKTILFNDRSIPGVVHFAGHNNHFHVQTWK